MSSEVVPLTRQQSVEAGALLAARHRRERTHYPLLPPGPADPAVAAGLVAGLLDFCDGVATIDDRGRLVGFLTAFEQLPDPSSPMARYAPERASVMLVHGHAVAETISPGPVYGALFAALAARSLEGGVIEHVAHVPIGDPAVEAAWVALGFGRVSAVAVRDLAPLPGAVASGIDVRVATTDDLDVVDRLIDEETVFHAASPMFRPYLRELTAAAVREQLAVELVSDAHAFMIARHDGQDVGVLSIGPGLGSPLYIPDGAAYVAATAVLPEVRRSGVGAALVDAALSWARAHGHRAVCLHFATANMASTAFWTGIGFVPVMVHLRRRLDDRILLCRPTA
jgi:GNAT superfamily N-acetyltransferase